MEASRIQFACANPEKSQKTKEILNNIISEEEGKLEFDRHKANPPPAFLVMNEKCYLFRRISPISDISDIPDISM